MYFDFFVAKGWSYLPSASVQTIYKLFTDPGYVSDHHIIDPAKYVLFYTMNGYGVISVGETKYRTQPNSVFIANTNTSLRYYCDADAWNFWLVEFKSDQLLLNVNHLYLFPFRYEYYDLFNLMLEHLKADAPLLCAAYFQVFRCTLQQQITRVEHEDTSLFTRCVAYMENHLSQFSVAQLCEDTAISPRTMNNLFQRTVGVSPYQYYQRLRAERSKEYLENTSTDIAQLATTLGYLNSGHFSRIFKQYFGKTPSQYRREFFLRA